MTDPSRAPGAKAASRQTWPLRVVSGQIATLPRLLLPERTRRADAQLGMALAFVAGATNAGGFLVVGRYTSHMTGLLSSAADELALGHLPLALAALTIIATFLLGAATTALLVNWGERRRLVSTFAIPLLIESALLLLFGLTGGALDDRMAIRVPLALLLLAYLMGLQNAVITKISRAEIRTTHMTGMITDLGIELGRFLYFNRRKGIDPVKPHTAKVRLHLLLVGSFFGGGLLGALGFQHFGYVSTLPLAAFLLLLSLPPLRRDLPRLRSGRWPGNRN